jgi:hypothetical protein
MASSQENLELKETQVYVVFLVQHPFIPLQKGIAGDARIPRERDIAE